MLEFVWWCKLQIGLDRDWLLAIFSFIGWDSDWVLAMFPLPTWSLLCVCQEFASGCQLCLNVIQGGLHYINLGLNIWDLHLNPQYNVPGTIGQWWRVKGGKPTCCFCWIMVVSDEGTSPCSSLADLQKLAWNMGHGIWRMMNRRLKICYSQLAWKVVLPRWDGCWMVDGVWNKHRQEKRENTLSSGVCCYSMMELIFGWNCKTNANQHDLDIAL